MNLRAHFEKNHRSVFKKIKELVISPGSVEKESEVSPPSLKNSNAKNITIDSILTDPVEKRLSTMTLDQAKCAIFEPETYKRLFLQYLMANNLPFAHVDSPALATLLVYARRCKTDDLPIVNRQSMRAALDMAYEDLVNELKSKLAKHEGKFALTLD